MIPRTPLKATAIALGGMIAGGLLTVRATRFVVPSDAQETGIGAARGMVLRADAISRVARARMNSVVFLHATSRVPGQVPAPRVDRPLPPQMLEPIREGLGSGVVIDANGGILTNAHLVQGMRAVHVRTPDEDDREATIVAVDPVTDLALLQATDAAGLQPAPLGDSDRTHVGDWVIAVGNPFGLNHTVTLGIVSARSRVLGEAGVELLQTDAAINPGSSGGPLFDLSGAVTGISTAMLAGSQGSAGLNFAVPINVAKEILPQLYAGEVVHGWIGVRTMALTRSGARLLGLDSPGGLVVVELASGGPADQAGIRTADVLLGAVDEPKRPARDLLSRVRRATPGDVLRLRVWRRRDTREVPVTVARWPAER